MENQFTWYQQKIDVIFQKLKTSPEGLSSSEASERLIKFGKNELPQKPPESILIILLRQINNPLIYVLMGSALLAVVMGKITDGSVVAGVVIVNALIGFFQEYRSSREIAALKSMVPNKTIVLRDQKPSTQLTSLLVPGDIVILQAGDRVPSDIRLFEAKGCKIMEAALTGESLPSDKSISTINEMAALADQHNMAFNGTSVVSGAARGVVVETGVKTELGKINRMLSETIKTETPLTRSIAKVAKSLTLAILIVSILLFAVALFRGYPLVDAVLAAITLAVAAIPEGIPAIITIALAIGVRRMAARRAVIRHLPAVETLGSTTVICSDKTGTITRNEMTVKHLWTPDYAIQLSGIGYEPQGQLEIEGRKVSDPPQQILELLRAGILCNDAYLKSQNGKWLIDGDPTEGALLTSARKAGLNVEAIRNSTKRLDFIPFESEYKFMATLNDLDGQRIIYLKGAPEVVIERCSLQPDQITKVHKSIADLAQQGMRILAFARAQMRSQTDSISFDYVNKDLDFLGLQALIDPPREEVKNAIEKCYNAGIKVKMITGDHQTTATAIGGFLGITGNYGSIPGNQLENMSEETLVETTAKVNIFARVAPEHKLKLVTGLQKNGEIVAMTGDGVNDAPALKKADIGVAMGITGTDVSKDAADIILTDDNFSTIVSAVEEGRRVYDNLIKSLAFVLPTNVGEAMILLVAVTAFPIVNGIPLLPMSPVQILWINLVATVSLALPLAFEAKERNIMNRPPRNPKEPLLNTFVIFRTVIVAVIITLVGIGLFLQTFSNATNKGIIESIALKQAQTMAVTSIVFLQIFYMINCRSLRESIFDIGIFSNPSVLIGIVILLILQICYVYVPFMNRLFGSSALDIQSWIESALYGAVVLPVITAEKIIRKRWGI
ncbi:MAG TPA: HAD-IC family P-type ATPase [Chitinispirillaceae bacterium]|nr:HAD-IC family P-type ATPase [Chitinispirillaceae bacterium]